jgi:Domain of unknown function (DUF397)
MIRWKKSSRSGNQGECVELAHTLSAIRDSKNPGGPVLSVPTAGFVAAVRDGQLDR